MINKIPATIKKSVAIEWLQVFPELGKYKPGQLYIRNGPVIHGINIQWSMGNKQYIPHYEIVPIKENIPGNDLSICLIHGFRQSDNKQMWLEIKEDSLPDKKNEFRELILKQCELPFNVNVATIRIAQKLHNIAQSERSPNIQSILETIRFLAGCLRNEYQEAALNFYNYSIEALTEIFKDKFARKAYETAYKMDIDMILSMYENEYYTLNYQSAIEKVNEKYNLQKLPIIL